MLKKNNVLLGTAIVCAFLCSYSSFIGYRAIIVICMFLLALNGKQFLLYPIVIFFYTQFGLFSGLSVSRLFSVFLLFSYFLLNGNKKKIEIRLCNFLILAIYTVYIIIVLTTEIVSLGIATLMNTVTIALLSSFYLSDENRLCDFFRVYIFVALLSIPAGINQANNMVNLQVIDGMLIETSRFMGTFEDPNYFTFFCYIAIVSLLTLKLFGKRIRILLIIVFQICVFSTLSITGIVCGVIIWVLYLVIDHKINWKLLIIIPCVFAGGVYLYNYGLQNPEAAIVGDLSMRLYEKFLYLNIGDMSNVTTGRTSLTQNHLAYFMDQSVFRILFGGNLANTKIMKLGSIRYAAHNEYVDILLNIGVIGAAVFFSCFIYNIGRAYRHKRLDKAKENSCNCIILMKALWLFYAATLTLFLEDRFMLFIFL